MSKFLPFRGSKVAVALSGGKDSVALAVAAAEITPFLQIDCGLLHVHHGTADEDHKDQKTDGLKKNSRDEAAEFCRELAEKLKLPLFMACRNQKQDLALKGESALREYRYSAIESMRLQNSFAYVAFAHHRDDLLETRLLRLLRGTGPQGLRSMKFKSGWKLRPFLDLPASAIADYARAKNLYWLEDPSNLESRFLRNWLRNEWLPALERRQPGASAAMSRSLELMTQTLEGQSLVSGDEVFLTNGTIDRGGFRRLSYDQKKSVVANHLHRVGARDFSGAQVEEILKRLDTGQKNLTFVIAGLNWNINAQRISAANP